MKAFFERTGVGEIFATESVSDFAAAVSKILADIDAYHAAITPQLLAEHSWEQQVQLLLHRYRELSGCDPQPREPRWHAAETSEPGV